MLVYFLRSILFYQCQPESMKAADKLIERPFGYFFIISFMQETIQYSERFQKFRFGPVHRWCWFFGWRGLFDKIASQRLRSDFMQSRMWELEPPFISSLFARFEIKIAISLQTFVCDMKFDQQGTTYGLRKVSCKYKFDCLVSKLAQTFFQRFSSFLTWLQQYEDRTVKVQKSASSRTLGVYE